MAKSTQLYDESDQQLFPLSLTSLIFDAEGRMLETRLQELEKLLDWFGFDDENGLIKAKFGMYSLGQLTAGGKGKGGIINIRELGDVSIGELAHGQSLVWDVEKAAWVNKLISANSEGVASLEADVQADVTVGFINEGSTLTKGMTLTELLQMMFSQAVKAIVPSVALSGVPAAAREVGAEVTLDLSVLYKDGYYTNTKEGTTKAGCRQGTPAYTLNGTAIGASHSFTASEPKVHSVAVSLPYEASTAVVTNKAGSVVDMPIVAGTARDSASFTVGYRAFWGYLTDTEAEDLTSALIRKLEHSDTIISPNSTTITLLNAENEVPGGEDLIIAVPEGYALSEVIDKTTSADFSPNFESESIEVNCAGNAKKNYTIYRCDNLTDSPMYITKIVIKKEA